LTGATRAFAAGQAAPQRHDGGRAPWLRVARPDDSHGDRPGNRQDAPNGRKLIHNSVAMSAPAKASSAGAASRPTPLRVETAAPRTSAPQSDSDHDLVQGLRRGEPWAGTALVRKYHSRVERLVAGALGVDGELVDVVQDVFLSVMRNAHQLKDPAALPGWIGSLAVFTARGYIRRRRRWRWIRFLAPEDVPDQPTAEHDAVGTATMRAVYRAIEGLPTDERLAFSLRFVAELELTEVAAACQVSLATIKRRLSRAEARFRAAAQQSPLLLDRLERGGRFASDEEQP
jgi:RNA polymerase sigma-70 factor (ECF subfamily)